ncbi:Trk-type K+ transport system membrane component [Lipingzhangella halophila]|uniref:Trk-type K+ transport system membrane component n=2 Tax=Lipingzhangella halophila TaxID=1783352 RepID=A0A7W7RDR8_9ACTN|nr:Trk-type K+ transport system membrane component [Lipingzhangella halophila]
MRVNFRGLIGRLLRPQRRYGQGATLVQEIPRFPWLRPARMFVILFAIVDLAGAGLLLLPAATTGDEQLTVVEALFTATTSLAVCGLTIIAIGADLSVFGHVVVIVLIQAGGIGIMALASVLGAVVIRRFGLRMQLSAQAETRNLAVGEVRGVVMRIGVVSLICEGVIALIIIPRMWLGHDLSLGAALYSGVFHAVSAFNNAGLSLYADSLTRFSGDPIILLTVAFATIVGGLGFPILLELRRHLWRPSHWTLHAKLTVYTTLLLYLGGSLVVIVLEWSNPATLGSLSWPARLVDGIFHGVMPRSGGFNVLDVGTMDDSSLLVTIMLMFVGNGSAGTAGGIKVATLAVIFLVVWSEIRGHAGVHVFGRRLSSNAIREALSLMFLLMTVVVVSTVVLLATTPFKFTQVLFEVVSAAGVVGLSTGITPDLPPAAQVLLIVLMVAGRIGPITFASALALRERRRRYDLAESRPIIG